jgi:hypothetical protein
MKLNAMTFTEHEVEGAIPESITVTMTPREMVFVMRMFSGMNDFHADAVLSGGRAEMSAIYACLSSVVAGQFEDLDEMIRVVAG